MTAEKQPDPVRRITLMAAPWTLYNRPSIQISVLKAYLNRYFPELHIEAWHLFLQIAVTIGYATYQALSQRTWLAETVYAAMLYPDRCSAIEKMYGKYARKDSALRHLAFADLVTNVQKATQKLVQHQKWQNVDLVGFSVSLCQMTSSLYIMREIKTMNPKTTIVAGGTTFCGPSARRFLDVFPLIDFIVEGEGEIPLAGLITHLNHRQKTKKNVKAPRGVVSRLTAEEHVPCCVQVSKLEQLPRPDYAEYFDTLKGFAPEKRFFPSIPVEASRGCWWSASSVLPAYSNRRAGGSGKKEGCAFCNLNLQWQGYRTKAPRQIAQDIEALTTAHQTLSVAFVDNVMPTSKGGKIFRDIEKIPQDIEFFGEIRANTSPAILKRMRRAGLREVQIGIESLSAGLLKKMNKGTRVIQNLEIMKHCEMLGLKNSSNLIMGFPGSDEHDVAETLATLDFALPFQPLKPVQFWLGLESPVWRNYREFNIKSIANHPGYGVLFPSKMINGLAFIIQTYCGDVTRQREAWLPVKRKINQWRRQYAEMHANAFSKPILGLQDGGTFLIIRQRRHRAESQTHRLTGLSREIYLFCQTNRSFHRILATFPDLTVEKAEPFLRMMVDKRLMFKENDRYLSLAHPACRLP